MIRHAALAAAAAAAALSAAGCGAERAGGDSSRQVERPRPARAHAQGVDRVPGRGPVVALVSTATWLRTAPAGRAVARLRARTQFGSSRVLAVVARRGAWIGVLAPELRNGRVGWLDARRATRLSRVPYTLEANLARRVLVVRRLGRRVASTRIAVGRPSAPTPLGRFGVTDKLVTGRPEGPYGCCVLALSGHQQTVLQGWGGGDRLAIHATPAPETVGQAVSHGCLRTTNAVMRRLLDQIPLGTPLRVRR